MPSPVPPCCCPGLVHGAPRQAIPGDHPCPHAGPQRRPCRAEYAGRYGLYAPGPRQAGQGACPCVHRAWHHAGHQSGRDRRRAAWDDRSKAWRDGVETTDGAGSWGSGPDRVRRAEVLWWQAPVHGLRHRRPHAFGQDGQSAFWQGVGGGFGRRSLGLMRGKPYAREPEQSIPVARQRKPSDAPFRRHVGRHPGYVA